MTINTPIKKTQAPLKLAALLLAALPGLLAAANQPPVQTYYVPFPEDQVLLGLQTITLKDSFGDGPSDPVFSYTSIAIFATNTVIYYDQWENGFDADIANPANLYAEANPGGTQIWGDGDPSNGFPPDYPDDILNAGDVIVLQNWVATAPATRQAVIDFDGGDKLASTKPMAVTRAAWATSSATLFALGNEVYATDNFGTDFRAPVGEDIPDNVDYQMFEYTGFFIMASRDGTTVQIDADNNGTFETTLHLDEGENYLVNGGVEVGGHIVSDKPIQVELLTGDKGSNYESRSMRLFPRNTWSSSLTTPVSTLSSKATTVWLYNPGTSALPVNYISRSDNNLVTNSISVPAGSYARQLLTEGTGARFIAPDGRPFYAVTAIDSNSSSSGYSGNQAADWGMTLIPDSALTPQALVGLGLGRDPFSPTNPDENGSPIWVTTIGNGNTPVRVYVDFDGDPLTGSQTDPHGNKYDEHHDVRELAQLKLYAPGVDQTRTLVYTLDAGVLLAAAWGQDPAKATEGAPGVDIGTGIPPLPLFGIYKFSALVEDADGDGFVSPGDLLEYTILIENTGRQPVTDLTVTDRLPEALRYHIESTVFIDHTSTTHAVGDDPAGTPFPLDGSGYLIPMAALPLRSHWNITYRTRIPSHDELPPGTVALDNYVAVNNQKATSSNGVEVALNGRIGDFVWLDTNNNGLQDPGEPGMPGTRVTLLDSSGNPVKNNKGYVIQAITDANGFYDLPGVPAGEYRVKFEPLGGYTLTDPNADGQGINGAANSTPDVLTGTTDLFTMTGGERKTTLDAGLKQTSLIGDHVWLDTNGNGLQDPLEPGVNGVEVRLLDSSGTPVLDAAGNPRVAMTIDHPITGEAGYYFFSDLAPGNYQLEFVLAGDDSFAAPNADGAGTLGASNSDVNPVTGRTPVIAVGSGDWITSVDAGGRLVAHHHRQIEQCRRHRRAGAGDHLHRGRHQHRRHGADICRHSGRPAGWRHVRRGQPRGGSFRGSLCHYLCGLQRQQHLNLPLGRHQRQGRDLGRRRPRRLAIERKR